VASYLKFSTSHVFIYTPIFACSAHSNRNLKYDIFFLQEEIKMHFKTRVVKGRLMLFTQKNTNLRKKNTLLGKVF
jgi:hypothetical protein